MTKTKFTKIQVCRCLAAVEQHPHKDTISRNVEGFGISQGLSQGMVRGICQDRDGFTWFCTRDGLDKYDSYHVTMYTTV